VTMEVVETVVPVGAPLSALRFDLDNIWYAQAGANLGTRTERVSKVTDDAGRALAFDHRNDEIIVQLAEPAPADRPVRLHFEIDGDFLVRPGGDNYWELGVSSWFPQPYLGEQAYTFHAVVRVPKPFVPFASGTAVYDLPGTLPQGSYGFDLLAYSRAFNPAGDGGGPATNWLADYPYIWTHPEVDFAVIDA